MRIAFIHNFCTHYTRRTFELLAKEYDVDFIFHSVGDDWYWQQEHGVQSGEFRHVYLLGLRLGRTRITPTLPFKLWAKPYDLYLASIGGRFTLPVTYLIARLKRKPFILWTGIWMRLHSPFHRLIFPLTRYVYKHADAIVGYGEHVKRYLVTEGVSEKRIFVAPHAVDNSQFTVQVPEDELQALRKKLDIGPAQKVILYLGRLEKAKGLPYLIEAFASFSVRDIVLVIAGTGSQHSYLQQLAGENGIAEKVRFPGYIQQDETVKYYALAWVYVLPSITTSTFKEPWGLVVNEAFNQGIPVIATEAVGAAAGGLVEDGVNGFIVPERDIEALTHAMARILEDTELRERMSQNARTKIAPWNQAQMVRSFQQANEYVMSAQ